MKTLLISSVLLAFPLSLLADEPGPNGFAKKLRPKVVMTEEGRKVHASTFVFDGHNDLPWELRTKADSSFDKRDIAKNQPEIGRNMRDGDWPIKRLSPLRPRPSDSSRVNLNRWL